MKTRITELLGIRHPVFQAAMSWASSNAPLVIAVSNAGALGMIAAGPMRPEEFRKALADIRAGTDKPYGVNIPLNNPRAAELLDIAFEARIPVMAASQGGPQAQLARFRALGTKWLHVVASVSLAMTKIEIALAVLVVHTTPVVIFPVSVWLLKNREELTPRTVLGAALVLAGIGFLAAR